MRAVAEKRLQARPVVSQAVYNLLARGIEQEHIPYLKAEGLGLVVYNPLAGGLLTDKYGEKRLRENSRFSLNEGYKRRYWNDENLAAWDQLRKIADGAGLGMMELAMRWLAGTGSVDAIITGFSTLDQLKANIAALDGEKLGADVMSACDAVWAGISGNRFAYNR